MNGDFYQLFGVDRQADANSLKKAYYSLCKVYHPDVRGDQQIMTHLNRAYEILSDPIKRAAYDQSLALVARKELVEKVVAQAYQQPVVTRPNSPYLRRQKTRLWAWMTAASMASA